MYYFLARNKVQATLLVTAYFLALVYFHDAATVAADWLKYQLTLKYYNLTFFIAGLAISLFTSYILLKKVKKNNDRRIFFYLFLITVAAMLVAVLTMTVVDMEAIHFIQYGLLSALILPITRRYESAFIYATVLGIIDEVYQYFILNPDFSYFDFNDIILNMLGAGAGLLILAVNIHPQVKMQPWKWYTSPAFWFIIAILAIALFFSLNMSLSFFPRAEAGAGGSLFSLYRKSLPDEFWTFLYGNRYYHILRPWEAISIMILLSVFYSLPDYLYRRAVSKGN
jgi:glycopeptide antibiotics resistance protein